MRLKIHLVWFFIFWSNCYCYSQLIWTNFNTTNSGLINNTGNALAVDKVGNVWLANGGTSFQGIQKFDGINWTSYTTTNSGLPTNNIRCIISDSNNVLWIGAYGYGLVRFDGITWQNFNMANSSIVSNYIYYMAIDKYNRLWMGCPNDGVSMFDGMNFTNFTNLNGLPPNNCPGPILADDSSSVWIVNDCNDGLAKYNYDTQSWFYLNTTTMPALPSGYTSAIALDHLNNLWIGYSFGNLGISLFDGSSINAINPYSLSTTWTQNDCIREDINNNIWIGSVAEGLMMFNGNQWHTYGSPLPANPNVLNMVSDNQRIWLREQHTGLWRIDIGTFINMNRNQSGLVLSPNPVHSACHVSFDSKISIISNAISFEVLNTLGQSLLMGNLNRFGSNVFIGDVNVDELPADIYTLKLFTASGYVFSKIIKQ
jgi:hypothetical protein